MAHAPGLIDKFWRNVLRLRHYEDDLCWVWLGHITEAGYGQIAIPKTRKDFVSAHRLSWEIHNGEIPKGMFVCHHCDNRGCVNPKHLFLGDAKTNRQDALQKGRLHKQVCKHGHLLKPGNLFYHTRNGYPIRTCLTCYRDRNNKSNLKKKELRERRNQT